LLKHLENRPSICARLIDYNVSSPEYHDGLKLPNPTSRTFDLPLGKVLGTQGFGFRYGDMIVRGDGRMVFDSSYLIMQGNAPRLYVYDLARTKKWNNVEIIVEYMRVTENNPPSYAGLGIGANSIHDLSPQLSRVPIYYLKHTFDGRFFFEKDGYTVRKVQNNLVHKTKIICFQRTFGCQSVSL
jgi:hypothetical protein